MHVHLVMNSDFLSLLLVATISFWERSMAPRPYVCCFPAPLIAGILEVNE